LTLECVEATLSGSASKVLAAATRTAKQPIVDSLTEGPAKWLVVADQNV